MSNIGSNDHKTSNQTNALVNLNKQPPSEPEQPKIENGTVTWGGKTYAITYGGEHLSTQEQQEHIKKIVLTTFNFLGDKIDPRSLAKMSIDPSQVEYQHSQQEEVVSEKFTGKIEDEINNLFKKITENPAKQELKNEPIQVKDLHDAPQELENKKLEEETSKYNFSNDTEALFREIENDLIEPESLTLKSHENFESIKNFIEKAGTNKISYNKKTGEFNIVDRKNEPLNSKVGNSKESRQAVEKLLAMIDDCIDKLGSDLKIGKNLEESEKDLRSIKDFLSDLKENTNNSWVKKVIENQKKSVGKSFDQVDHKAQNLMESLQFVETTTLPNSDTKITLPKENHGLAELGRCLENSPGEFKLTKGKLSSPISEQKPHEFNNEKRFAETVGEVVLYINAVKQSNPSEAIQENLDKITKSLSENPKIYLLLKNPEHKKLKDNLDEILPKEKFFKKIKTGGVDLQQIQRKMKKIKNEIKGFSSYDSFDDDFPTRKLLSFKEVEEHKKEIAELTAPVRSVKEVIDEIKKENSFNRTKVNTKEIRDIISINELKIKLLEDEQLKPLVEERRKVAEEINSQLFPSINIKSDLKLNELAIIGQVTDYIGGEPVVSMKDTTGISSSFDDVMKSEAKFQKQMVVFRKMIDEIGPAPEGSKKEALELLDNIIQSSERLLKGIGDPPSIGGMLKALDPANMQRIIKNFIEFSNNKYLNQEFDKGTTNKFIQENIKNYQDVSIDLDSLQKAAVQRGLRYPMMFKDGVKAQLERYERKKNEGVEGYDKDLNPFHEAINQIEPSLALLGVLFDSLKS